MKIAVQNINKGKVKFLNNVRVFVLVGLCGHIGEEGI